MSLRAAAGKDQDFAAMAGSLGMECRIKVLIMEARREILENSNEVIQKKKCTSFIYY